MMPENKHGEDYWFFNTNESHGPGAYHGMFQRDVAAIWGYADGPLKLEGARRGDCILAYVNGQGLRAFGTVVDGEVEEGKSIFLSPEGQQRPNEFHLKVKWDIVTSPEIALSFAAARGLGCELPVRCTFARFKNVEQAKRLVEQLRISSE